MKIKVYDIEKLVTEITNGEHEVHRDKKIALFLNDKYQGLYMSFDSCGYSINGENDTVEIGTNLTADKKPNTFRIVNSHTIQVPLKEFLEKATFEVVDEKDYFWQTTKPRVQNNYRKMMMELNKLGIKGEQENE